MLKKKIFKDSLSAATILVFSFPFLYPSPTAFTSTCHAYVICVCTWKAEFGAGCLPQLLFILFFETGSISELAAC